MEKKSLKDIQPVDEHHKLLLRMMISDGITQATIVEETGVNKTTVHRYVYYGFKSDFWAKLQGPYGARLRYLKKLEGDQLNKYAYQVNDEQEEKWEEQKSVNTQLQIENAQQRTRIEALEEKVASLEKQLKPKDVPPGEDEIPGSDEIPADDLLDD